MASPMELDYSWPLGFGDQLRPFDDGPTFDLLAEAEGSDACEYGLFDGVVEKGHRQDVSPVSWSNNYDTGYSNPSVGLISPLSSSPEVRYDLFALSPEKVFATKSDGIVEAVPQFPVSPVQELPTSPENFFTDVLAFHAPACTPDSRTISGFVPASGFVENGELAIEQPATLYGRQAVPEVWELENLETSEEEDMLFGFDDIDSDIVIDHEKLASIGPDLPSVSPDDVISVFSPESTFINSEVPSIIASPAPVSSPSLEIAPQVTPVFYLAPVGSPDVDLSFVGMGAGSPNSPVGSTQGNITQYVVISSPNSPIMQGNSVAGYSAPNSPGTSSSSPYLLISSPNSPVAQHGNGVSVSVVPNSPWSAISTSSSCASLSSAGAISKPPVERRLRKKEQNKTAAQRYREKKRGEHGTVLSEYELLERRNTELRTKVDDMTKEISYLKGLIEEICA
jgi:hypothetical protein